MLALMVYTDWGIWQTIIDLLNQFRFSVIFGKQWKSWQHFDDASLSWIRCGWHHDNVDDQEYILYCENLKENPSFNLWLYILKMWGKFKEVLCQHLFTRSGGIENDNNLTYLLVFIAKSVGIIFRLKLFQG